MRLAPIVAALVIALTPVTAGAGVLEGIQAQAEEGSAVAQLMLGNLYIQGQVVPQNFAKAVKWYRRAAEQDLSAAQFSLGDMYREGQGVRQNYTTAAKWHRLAAEQGHASAQHDLGVMYHNGQGVGQDHVQAHMWLNLSSFSFPPGELRDKSVQGRDATAKLMTPDQVAEAEKLAREWKPRGEPAE